ncbi:MAG: hypothetical protein ACK5P5_13265 [Pseudobdellovibrionaceae bacterium]
MIWLVSKKFDLAWFVLPNFLSVALAMVFSVFVTDSVLPVWFWIVFVLMIDVGHVYSTLFRIYFVPEERKQFSQFIWLIPIMVWIAGMLLYSMNKTYFWTGLAYVAVFHFIRQQYGFLAIYQNEKTVFWKNFEKWTIYLSMIHPVVYWHSHPETVFRWFIQDDFIFADLSFLSSILGIALVAFLVVITGRFVYLKSFFCKEIIWPRYFLIIGTALSWHVGIVAFNSDVVFTITNVVSHGLPYYGLIIAYSMKQKYFSTNRIADGLLMKKYLGVTTFVFSACVLFAYIEEGLWHSLHWRSYIDSFFGFRGVHQITDGVMLSLIIPLLAVPQATHYVLDGFIWKIRGPNSSWKTKIINY